jgi:hypothetical protein
MKYTKYFKNINWSDEYGTSYERFALAGTDHRNDAVELRVTDGNGRTVFFDTACKGTFMCKTLADCKRVLSVRFDVQFRN